MQSILDGFNRIVAAHGALYQLKAEKKALKRKEYYAKNRDRILARRKELKRIRIEEFERKQKEEADRLQMIIDLEYDSCVCSAIQMPPCSFCEKQGE
jgi:uncharacterized protein (DUF3084 family)